MCIILNMSCYGFLRVKTSFWFLTHPFSSRMCDIQFAKALISEQAKEASGGRLLKIVLSMLDVNTI